MTALLTPVAPEIVEVQTLAPNPARAGIRDAMPFAIAVIPFAFAIGTASANAGLSFTEAIFGAFALLAGASQLAAVELIGAGEEIALTVLMVALINLRFVFYGAGLVRWFAELSRRQQLALAIPLVDATFMLGQERFGEHTDTNWRRTYYIWVSLTQIVAFVSSQILAYVLGASVPDALGLHLAAPLCFVGMLIKSASSRSARVAGAVAAALVICASGTLGPLALPIAAAAGVAAATTLIGEPS